ncbi:hypothetical protein ACFLYH_01070 [Candidatus Dependentiae bacterium]
MLIYKFFSKILFFLFILLYCFDFSIKPATFDIKSLVGKHKYGDFIFPTNIETRRKRIEYLNQYLEDFTKRSKLSAQEINSNLTDINKEILDIDTKLTSEPDIENVELLNEKLNLLQDRKQNFLRLQELWKNTELLIKKNIQLIKEFINQYKLPITSSSDTTYSWDDFIQIQENILNYEDKINLENTKRVSLIKQRDSEKSNLNYLKKQIENKNKELINLKANTQNLSNEELRLKDIILKQEISFASEKITYSNLKTENLNQEIKSKENEIELQEYELNLLKKKFKLFEKTILNSPQYIITLQDQEKIKNELEEEKKRAFKEKENLNQSREIKKKKQQKIFYNIDTLKQKLKKAKAGNDEIAIYLLQTELEKLENQSSLFDKVLSLIDAKVELETIIVTSKELEYKKIELYKNIASEKVNLDELSITLKKQTELLVNSIKVLRNKRKEEESSISEINRNIENIKKTEIKIKEQKNTLFKFKEKTYNEILNNIIQIEKLYNQQQKQIQKYLTINTELISKQERIIKRLNFTISSLEEKQVSINIWKRSPKAISLNNLIKSISEAESFFGNLFWATPNYLAPTIIINTIKKFNLYNYLNLLLFIVNYKDIFEFFTFKNKNYNASLSQSEKYFIYIIDFRITDSICS